MAIFTTTGGRRAGTLSPAGPGETCQVPEPFRDFPQSHTRPLPLQLVPSWVPTSYHSPSSLLFVSRTSSSLPSQFRSPTGLSTPSTTTPASLDPLPLQKSRTTSLVFRSPPVVVLPRVQDVRSPSRPVLGPLHPVCPRDPAVRTETRGAQTSHNVLVPFDDFTPLGLPLPSHPPPPPSPFAAGRGDWNSEAPSPRRRGLLRGERRRDAPTPPPPPRTGPGQSRRGGERRGGTTEVGGTGRQGAGGEETGGGTSGERAWAQRARRRRQRAGG